MPITIIDLLEKIEQMDIESAAEQSVNDTASAYAQKNIDQMYSGKLNNGKDIEPEYAESTKKRKRKRGEPADRVTLKDKGKFYSGYKAKASDGYITSESDVEYEKYIDKKYTEKIHGLNDDSMSEYVESQLWDAFREKLEDQINL
jgi:hypothetical protein